MTSVYDGVDMDTETLGDYGGLLWRDALDTAKARNQMTESASLPGWVFGELPESTEWAGNWNKYLDNRLEEGLTLATELGEHAGKILQVAADHSAADEQAAQKIDGVLDENSPNNSYQIPEVTKNGQPPSPDLNVDTGEYGPVGELVQPSPKTGSTNHVTRIPFPKPQPTDILSPDLGASKALLHEFGTLAEATTPIPDFTQQSEGDRLDQVMAEHGTKLYDAEMVAKFFGVEISDEESPLRRFIIPVWKSSPKTIKQASDNLRELGGNGYYQGLSGHYNIDTQTAEAAWESAKGSKAWSSYATTTGEYIETATLRVDGLADYGTGISNRLSSIRDTCAAVVSQKALELEKAKGDVYKAMADVAGSLSFDPIAAPAALLKAAIVGITNEIQKDTLAELTSNSETSSLNAQVDTRIPHDAALEVAAPFPRGELSRSW